MNRRDFLLKSTILGSSLLLPKFSFGKPLDLSGVKFDKSIYEKNAAQTIMIFLYGGASELGGNLTNIEEIKQNSQSDYSYFRGLTPTSNHFWQEAGGEIMEELLESEDMNIFRTCYSKLRDEENNRSHGRCVSQNQRGINNDEDTAGIFAILSDILYQNKVIDENSKLPFVTMEGESIFYSTYDLVLPSFLKPVSIDDKLKNPYKREWTKRWYYYTKSEKEAENYQENRAALDIAMDELAQKKNKSGKIKEDFDKRVELESFIDELKNRSLPQGVTYPKDNSFADKLKVAVNLAANNPDTKIISLGSDGLGGWDDHNEARDYPVRMVNLFSAIKSAISHIKALQKEGEINIIVWGDFGRNVNLNSAKGWDHGNNQNLYLFCGKNYFNHTGIVGETYLPNVGAVNRMYLKPKESSYSFEPFAVASTIYKLYGITNPKILTGGIEEIKAGLLKS